MNLKAKLKKILSAWITQLEPQKLYTKWGKTLIRNIKWRLPWTGTKIQKVYHGLLQIYTDTEWLFIATEVSITDYGSQMMVCYAERVRATRLWCYEITVHCSKSNITYINTAFLLHGNTVCWPTNVHFTLEVTLKTKPLAHLCKVWHLDHWSSIFKNTAKYQWSKTTTWNSLFLQEE
jgi:hypothetical protein